MPAIQSIQPRETIVGTSRERIQELKARATESLDDAMTAVARNLGRREAAEAEAELNALGLDLAAQGSSAHSLDRARVMDLISDPFGDD
ncbi:hypothetical protein [Desulfovibrio sp. Fe33]|uniref:hypothetical protein n=1 Tax=Desulfovibrio sp. Fe33 TaxID=3020842 RepID=UPI00234D7887|nr:hypothetical protein [Desulfovibrio sp. Fe33]